MSQDWTTKPGYSSLKVLINQCIDAFKNRVISHTQLTAAVDEKVDDFLNDLP